MGEGEVSVERAGSEIARLSRSDFVEALHKIQRGESAEYTFNHERPVSLFRISRKHALEFASQHPGCGMKLAYRF